MQLTNQRGYRLSPQQVQILRESPHGSLQAVIRLRGELQTQALQDALRQIVKRHSILHTIYPKVKGLETRLQVLSGDQDAVCEIVRLQNQEAQAGMIQSLIQAQKKLKFDGQDQLPIDMKLVLLSEQEALLLLKLSAMSADRWTVSLLQEELAKEYARVLEGSGEPEETMQYLHYSEWIHEIRESEDQEVGECFWNEQDFSALAHRLPFSSYEEGVGYTPHLFSIELSESRLRELERIADHAQVTVEDVLFTAWQILLWKQSSGNAVVVGREVSGRPFEEMDTVFGRFSRWLPVITSWDANLKLSDALLTSADQLAELIEWQEHYQDSLLPGSLTLAFGHDPMPIPAESRGVRFEVEEADEDTHRFQLLLRVQSGSDKLRLKFIYDASGLDSEFVKLQANYYVALLEEFCRVPDAVLQDFRYLPADEREKYERVSPAAARDTQETVVTLFEKQAAQTPDQPAVRFESNVLTYQELNERANQLAHRLQSLGTGVETRVVLCVNRSIEMIVGMLGILKAGAVYVPIDPAFPKERLGCMIEDSEAQLLITQAELLGNLPDFAGTMFVFQELEESLANEPVENLSAPVTTQHLAYVIYTSGTTGRPKGVQVEHGNLMHYFYGIVERLQVNAGASFASVSTLAADLGHTAIFPALLRGGTLHVISQERALDAQAFAEYMEKYPFDVLKIVPSHYKTLMQSGAGRDLLPRQCLIFGGESLTWDIVEQIRKVQPHYRIFNHYGPTETTVGAMAVEVEEGALVKTATVPLGFSLNGVDVYVLDESNRILPVGCKGEIYIGGDGLARGYLNRPEETSARFVPHFLPAETGRLYKTGDLGRYLPNGQIEFLGRIDNQVKIRGIRIELDEIEIVLRSYAFVQDSVVLYEEAKQCLIAYFVTTDGEAVDVSAWQQQLKEQLPGSMVPTFLIKLPKLPLTINGKVDRAALPAPENEIPYRAPRNKMESDLVKLWEEFLGVSRVGICDEFVSLGGNSLIAVRLLAEIQKRFDQNISLLQIYHYNTIEQLAEFLNSGQPTEWQGPLFALKKEGTNPPFFCMHPGGGDVACYAHMVKAIDPNQPFYGLEAPGYADDKAPYDRIPDYASIYIPKIREVQPHGPYYLGGWSFGGVVAYEVALQLQALGEEIAYVGMFDTTAPLPQFKFEHSIDDVVLLKDFATTMARDFGIQGYVYPDGHDKEPAEILTEVARQAEAQGSMPVDKTLDEVLRFYKVFRANRHAFYHYVPESHLDCVTLYRSTEKLEQFHGVNPHPSLGWGKIVPQVEVQYVRGDHLTMVMQPDCAKELAAAVCQSIEEKRLNWESRVGAAKKESE